MTRRAISRQTIRVRVAKLATSNVLWSGTPMRWPFMKVLAWRELNVCIGPWRATRALLPIVYLAEWYLFGHLSETQPPKSRWNIFLRRSA
jgi:hypothetical protein